MYMRKANAHNTEGMGMAKTTEQLKAEFINLMAENSFVKSGETLSGGREVYHRIWTKEVDVVWHGKMESKMEIKVDEKDGIPMIRIYKDGSLKSRHGRGYSSPKRMINALREIITFAGFEF